MNNLNLPLSIENDIYIFTINIIGFAKTLEKNGYSKDDLSFLVKTASLINDFYNKGVDKIVTPEKTIKDCLVLGKKLHKKLLQLKVDKIELINEKADLQIEMSSINRKIEKLLVNRDYS